MADAVVPIREKSIIDGGGSYGPVPVLTDDLTFRQIGSSGLRAFGGWVREEFLPELQGRQAARVYREMADNSPIIGGVIYAIMATMRKVEWRTVPADDTPAAQEMADFADSLRDDMSHTWEDSIAEGLSMLTYGFAPQEIVYKRRLGKKPGMAPRTGKDLPKSDFDDGRIGWRKLPIMGQDTVIKWFFDPNGEVLGLTQQPWTGPLIDVPIEKTLLFRPSQHKGNPEGRSILRSAYRPWYFSKRIEEQEAILFERLNGIPVIRVPNSLMEQAAAGNAQAAAALAAFKRIAVNLRIDDQMGLVLPSDVFMGNNGPTSVQQFGLELVAPGGTSGSGAKGSTSASETITRHDNNALLSVLADFLSLGHGKVGTQALSISKQDMFFQAIEGYLNSMAAVYNRHGLTRAWELNGFDPALMPQITPDLAQRVDLDVLSNFVLRLGQSGMAMFPNPVLEEALLDAAGLPDIQDPDAMAALDDGDGPVPIVGPNAAQLMPQPDPPAKGNFEKMVMASLARRMLRAQGPSSPISTRRKKWRMPAQA